MASPALLAQRTTQAIQDNDVPAFARWTKHPRWRTETGWAEEWVLAAVRAPDPIAWLERLDAKGVELLHGGYRMPAVCEASRLGRAPVVAWLLDKGAQPTAASDYGMGRSLAFTALDAGAEDVLGVLWEKTGRLWSLLRPAERKAWLEPSSLPVLKQMHARGWSLHHSEVDPEADVPDSKVSFAQWLETQDSLTAVERDSLVATLDQARLEHGLPGAGPEGEQLAPSRPRF